MSFDLDESQQEAWELYLGKKNVCLFGRAGCGKSTLLLRAIAHAQRTHGTNRVVVLAWTNFAANLAGGQTLHKFLRVGIADVPKEIILEKVRCNAFARESVKAAKVIFIDELPQFPARWFAVLEYVVRQLALDSHQGRPWGGIHVVVAGDALQLGPVHTARQVLDTPVYDSRTFRDTFMTRYGQVVVLRGSHRQVHDSWFVECLDRVRMGKVTESDVRTLNATSDGVTDEEWESRTQLRAVNRDVNSFNAQKLASLPGPAVTYACRDEVNERITHPNRVAYAKRRLGDVAPAAVTVKPGAVVLLIRAVSHVASGTQGVVVHCCESHVVCSFGGAEVRVHFISFDVVDNCNVRLASRFALPLALGWAMTIHRAQGTTLDTLAIDFTHLNWREPGLAYSGLSRCRLLENLYVRGLRMHCVVASENAMSFYAKHTRDDA